VSELLLAVVFPLVVVSVRGGSRGGWLFVLLAAAVGYLLPAVWLARKTALRQKQIQHGLPDALDLFIVCIEAGSSIDQAIVKSSDELEISYPALADELRLVTTETRAGKPRLEAFKNFASRTRVDDVRALSAMLIQTDRFGTSVAQAFRAHAETARVKRRQKAEEKAGKIGVKLVFPLVFFLFPALYVAVLGQRGRVHPGFQRRDSVAGFAGASFRVARTPARRGGETRIYQLGGFMDTTTIVGFRCRRRIAVLYMMRRRSRLGRED